MTYLLRLISSTTSVWRLIYVFWAQRSNGRLADSTQCTQTSVYSARAKYIVRHWTCREASLRHSSGWGFPLSSVICAPVVYLFKNFDTNYTFLLPNWETSNNITYHKYFKKIIIPAEKCSYRSTKKANMLKAKTLIEKVGTR